MSIQSIETRYASCRFRSRLEARWAVFFDHLGIRWEYEPQGFHVGPNRHPYLPDFRLMRGGDLAPLWVEVKGAGSNLDRELLAQAVDKDYGFTDRLLILGPIPHGDPCPTHPLVRSIFGVPCWTWVLFGGPDGGLVQIYCEEPLTEATLTVDPQIPHSDMPIVWTVFNAYEAARSARFEHGENPGGAS